MGQASTGHEAGRRAGRGLTAEQIDGTYVSLGKKPLPKAFLTGQAFTASAEIKTTEGKAITYLKSLLSKRLKANGAEYALIWARKDYGIETDSWTVRLTMIEAKANAPK